MSMFNNLPGFDLMGWLNQGRQAGIDFTQLARPRPRPREGEPHFDAFWDEPVYGPEVDTFRPRPSEPPPNQSMFSMMDILSAILNNRQGSTDTGSTGGGSGGSGGGGSRSGGSIPYERKATDNYEGFYSTPYAPLKEGMTKEDLGKITAGNLGASAGFR